MYNSGVRGICSDKGLMIETTAFNFLPGERGGRCTGGGKRGGQEVGFPWLQEVGEKGENYATWHNILQSEKHKVGIANKNRALTGI